MKLNKDDIYGIVGSVAFHLFILLILGFTVLKTVVPDEDGGILAVSYTHLTLPTKA